MILCAAQLKNNAPEIAITGRGRTPVTFRCCRSPRGERVLETEALLAIGGRLKLALLGETGSAKRAMAYAVCSLLKKAPRNVELVTEVARQSPFPVSAATTIEGQ